MSRLLAQRLPLSPKPQVLPGALFLIDALPTGPLFDFRSSHRLHRSSQTKMPQINLFDLPGSRPPPDPEMVNDAIVSKNIGPSLQLSHSRALKLWDD